MYEEIQNQLSQCIAYLKEAARLRPGAVVVLGCSTSEVAGGHIGKNSVPELGDALAAAIAHLARWSLWQPWTTSRAPLVWVLHAAYLPSNGGRQMLWLPEARAGRARLKLDQPGYYFFGCPVMNHAGRGMLGLILVKGDTPEEAKLDRPPQPRPRG